MLLGFFRKKDTRSLSFTQVNKSSCYACGLYKHVQSPKMEPCGNFKKKIMVIGEAPGEREDAEGKPFQGKTGRLLQRTLEGLGVDLFEDCIVLNAVNCHPADNRKPSPNEIKCCRDVKVLKAINEFKPKVVLVLGDVALTSVLGVRWKAGQLGGIYKWSGWNIPDQDYKMWICPCFHPSYVERQDDPVVNLIWEKDLKRAIDCLKKRFPIYKEPTIRYIEDLQELRNIDTETAAFDYEATGLKPHAKGHQVVTASIAVSEDEVVSFLMPEKESERGPFIEFLQSKTRKIASNMKYEDHWSHERIKSYVKNWYHDTMLWAHVLDNRPGTTSLKFQTYVRFGIISYEEDEKPFLRTPDKTSANEHNKILELLKEYGGQKQLLEYNALDSIYEYRLAVDQFNEVEEMEEERQISLRNAYQLFHDGILALARAERQGIRVDVEAATKQYDELTKVINELETQFKKTKFFKHWDHATGKQVTNIHSNHQLANFLYKVKKIDTKKTTKSGQGAVDEEALAALNIPELSELLRIRKLKKLRDTYLNGFIQESINGILHPFFNLQIAVTYRSSSDSPNFQNIPVRDEEAKKIIRKCLKARPGHQILEIDFKQIEVGVAACYHKDPTMIKYIEDKFDMHGDMAKQIFHFKEFDKKDPAMKRLRNAAKNGFVFPQFYGDYYGNNAGTLSEWASLPVEVKYKPTDGIELANGMHLGEHLINNGIKSYKNFLDHLQAIEDHFWTERFPVYNSWKKKWYSQYQKQGYFDMLTGFRCSGIMSPNDVTNYPVQGAAFHCLLWCFIQMDRIIRKNKWKTRLIGQIHDSMLFDLYPPEREDVLVAVRNVCEKKLPAKWSWIIVPMTVEAEICGVDESWYDKKEIELI